MSTVSLKRRFVSMLYDSFLILSLIFIGTIPFIALRSGEAVESSSTNYKFTLFLISYFFFVSFWYLSSRTLGMQSWKIRLISFDGKKPNLTQCTVRFIAAIFSWIPFGMGFWWQLLDKDNLSWHDHLSKTKLNLEKK